MNPLKAGVGATNGHTPENVAWISEDGNRIQDALTLDAVKNLLRRVAKNYEDANEI